MELLPNPQFSPEIKFLPILGKTPCKAEIKSFL